MFIIRGENIYPSAIENTLRSIDGFGGEFQVIISRQENMDELLIKAEYSPSHSSADLSESLRNTITEQLRTRLGVRPTIELVPQGVLPRTEFKARRAIDNRELYQESLNKSRQIV
jgi:phenylacetate-CoA ligase